MSLQISESVNRVNGFQRRKESKMRSLLLAAFDLFSEHGMKKVTVAQIAERAKVSQGSIYNFFRSKKNLAREAIFAFMDDRMEKSESVLASDRSFLAKLRELLFISGDADEETNVEFIRRAVNTDPLIKSLMEEHYHSRTEPLLMRLFEQGQAEGSIDSELSPEAFRLYVDALRQAFEEPGASAKVRADLEELFFHGLQGREPAR